MNQLPDTIKVDAAELAAVIAVTAWYDQIPDSFTPGDSFHERIFGMQSNLLPEELCDDGATYASYFEVNDGRLYVFLGQDNGAPHTLHPCELIAE